MIIETATHQRDWDAFLGTQRFRPFLQSWTMGEVFEHTGQKALRLLAREGEEILGICQAILVPARRGRHLAVHYGPVIRHPAAIEPMMKALGGLATEQGCSFVRLSPFVPEAQGPHWQKGIAEAGYQSLPSPLHLLGEHVWYLPLREVDPWHVGKMPQPGTAAAGYAYTSSSKTQQHPFAGAARKTEEELLMQMRKTTRNLIRRAEKDGVTVTASEDPVRDVDIFLKLHEETRQRHSFTPYRSAFFRAQVEHFAPRGECTLYIARYQGDVLATSIHMHAFGETSYHHGASTHAIHPKVPASYLLQWTAIRDALKRGDNIYSFWGIAPLQESSAGIPACEIKNPRHPFAGVTLFKTGFGGSLLNLTHCIDVPLSATYRLTRAFEYLRKWRRGF